MVMSGHPQPSETEEGTLGAGGPLSRRSSLASTSFGYHTDRSAIHSLPLLPLRFILTLSAKLELDVVRSEHVTFASRSNSERIFSGIVLVPPLQQARNGFQAKLVAVLRFPVKNLSKSLCISRNS